MGGAPTDVEVLERPAVGVPQKCRHGRIATRTVQGAAIAGRSGLNARRVEVILHFDERRYIHPQNPLHFSQDGGAYLRAKPATKPHHFAVSDYTDSFAKVSRIFFGKGISLVEENIWG